ncbi:hypothetical protein [Robiginitalea sediminis]|uniref:hypothetical protein n=1 Tax=Robiginitalea sediminis TaxID=1982593 RepID=UPI001E6182B1|nr:hypothetical protein [Robiginitalea sediminis]
MRIGRTVVIMMALGLMGSCQWFASSEARTRERVARELNAIDWNRVDQFPLFDTCDELAEKQEKRRCFEQTLVMHLTMTLQDFEFRSEGALKDTLYIDFIIDNQGGISVLSIENLPELERENPQFEGIISRSLKSLPRLQPALKQGIPVATQYRLPLILSTDE